jgi:diguanylate cyclase (GGDEF)-like protein
MRSGGHFAAGEAAASGRHTPTPQSSEQVTLELVNKTYYGAVATVSRLDLSTFPDSPYAAELQRDSSKLRFSPKLEAEYSRARLLSSRTLVRVVCLSAAALGVFRGFEELSGTTQILRLVVDLGLAVGGSVALAWIAWSKSFERVYPRWARIVVPLRNSILVAHIAAAASHGQPEILMAVPIILIGPFFFLGLAWRASLFCCAATVASYILSSVFFGMPEPIAIHSYMLLLSGVAACVVAVWHLEKVSRRSFLESQLIAELAQRDPLTGTKNRRVFDEHLQRLWQQAIVNGRAMAIVLIDIDHFKAYNDGYGHQAGDQTLCRVAQTAQKLIRRPLDILTRYGGEEFAAILYDIDQSQARATADRMRRAVEELNIEHRASRTSSRVTISVGIAVIEPTAERNPRGALQLADQALYEAKVKGRNRVELMDTIHHSMMETGVFAIGPRGVSNKCAPPATKAAGRKA